MFYIFCFNKVPSKTFRIAYGDSCVDPTENCYEGGIYACRNWNNVKFPLYVLKILKLCLFCLPMLVDYCSHKLFDHKIPMHRKRVRLKCASNKLHDAPVMFQFLSFMWASLKSSCLARGVKQYRLLGGNPILFLIFAFCSYLVINNLPSLWLDVVLCFN